MYGILIDGVLQTAPRKVEYNSTIIYNPPDEVYEALGYYHVTFVEEPQDAPEGYHYEFEWTQDADEILQVWSLVEDSDEVDEVEALNILLGGAE